MHFYTRCNFYPWKFRLCRILNLKKTEEGRTERERERETEWGGENGLGELATKRMRRQAWRCKHATQYTLKYSSISVAAITVRKTKPFSCVSLATLEIYLYEWTRHPCSAAIVRPRSREYRAWKKSRGRCAHSRPPLFVYGKQGNSRGRKNIAVPRAFDRKFGERERVSVVRRGGGWWNNDDSYWHGKLSGTEFI